MSFLSPLWLVLAGAVAVPLLLHLLRRRIGLRVEFPAARYLARAEQEHSRSLRLRNLLLMLLRVLAVLALAVAAARPVGRHLGAGHAPTALAIVVDNSMSSGIVAGGQPVLAALVAHATQLLARSTADDRLWLVTADGRVRAGDAATLRNALGTLEPLAGAGDPAGAVTKGAAAVRASGLDAREVAVVTDGQRTAWTRVPAVEGAQALVWAPDAPAPPNRAIVSAEPRPSRWTPRGEVVVRLSSGDSAALRVDLARPGGDPRPAARSAAPPDGEVTLAITPAERGWLAGRVEIEPDELPADDVRHFAVWSGPPSGVSVSASAGPFARSAADVLRGAGRIGDGTDVALVAADELRAGPALILAPSDPVRIGAANRALERAGVPWRLGSLRREESIARGPGLAGVIVRQRFALQPAGVAPAETLATVGGQPWIVAGNGYVLVGSPLLPDATTLPVSAGFLPWLGGALGERLVGGGQVIAATPGARVPRPSWADELQSPDGARLPLGDPFTAPTVAGTSFLLREGRVVGALTVNPEPDESKLARVDAAEVARRLGPRAAAPPPDRWAEAAFSAGARASLVTTFLIVALVLLVLEALFVRVSGPRQA